MKRTTKYNPWYLDWIEGIEEYRNEDRFIETRLIEIDIVEKVERKRCIDVSDRW